MRRCVMLIIRHSLPHRCERCKKPVRQNGDYLQAQLWGRCSYWHWGCWIRQLRESERQAANAVAEVVR